MSAVVHGDAAGADRWAARVVQRRVGPTSVRPEPAHWERYGDAAGPIRNAAMIQVARRWVMALVFWRCRASRRHGRHVPPRGGRRAGRRALRGIGHKRPSTTTRPHSLVRRQERRGAPRVACARRCGALRRAVRRLARGADAAAARRQPGQSQRDGQRPDGLLVNAWRSIQWSPDATAEAASWPVTEADMHARHLAPAQVAGASGSLST